MLASTGHSVQRESELVLLAQISPSIIMDRYQALSAWTDVKNVYGWMNAVVF